MDKAACYSMFNGVWDYCRGKGVSSHSGDGPGRTNNGDGTYSCDGSQSSTSNLQTHNLFIDPYGQRYEANFEVISRTAGSIKQYVGSAAAGAFYSTSGIKSERILESGIYHTYILQADADFIGTVRPVSLRQISPAQGTLTVNFYVGVDAADVPNNTNINVICNSDLANRLVYFRKTSAGDNTLNLYDLTTPASIIYNWAVGCYRIDFSFGYNQTTGQLKQQISIVPIDGLTLQETGSRVVSVLADFDGNYDVGTLKKLIQAYNAAYPVGIISIKSSYQPIWRTPT